MKTIPLTQGQVALVDDGDYESLSKWKWCFSKKPKGRMKGYAVRWNPLKRRNSFMHREILDPGDGKEIDHVNGNGLDNQRCNLRKCSRLENMRNQRKKVSHRNGVPCSSRFKGVHWQSAIKKWRAQIYMKGKKYHLGDFKSELDAAEQYNIAAQLLFDKFALPQT